MQIIYLMDAHFEQYKVNLHVFKFWIQTCTSYIVQNLCESLFRLKLKAILQNPICHVYLIMNQFEKWHQLEHWEKKNEAIILALIVFMMN